MSFLEIKDISFRVNGKEILAPLSFELEDADYAGVIGPNGAGKSTLLKLIAGIYSPLSGTVKVDGKNIAYLTAKERAKIVAYLPQAVSSSELRGLTVGDLVLTGRFPYYRMVAGYQAADKRLAKEIMDEMGLSVMAHRDVSTLSGGEFQKVLLAGAMVQDARIYLLDEAFSFLDVRYRFEMEMFIKKLLKKGRIIICVFHHIDESLYNKNRIIALKDGSLFYNGGLKNFMAGQTAKKLYGIRFRKIHDGKHVYLWPELDG